MNTETLYLKCSNHAANNGLQVVPNEKGRSKKKKKKVDVSIYIFYTKNLEKAKN